MLDWQERYGALPSSYDWSETHAQHRGGEAIARLNAGEWPAAATVGELYGSWQAAKAEARRSASRSPAR